MYVLCTVLYMVTILSLGFIQITLFDLIRTKLRSFKSGDYIILMGKGMGHTTVSAT